MAEKVNLTKNVFNKQQFTKTVNTQFSEPATTPSLQPQPQTPLASPDQDKDIYIPHSPISTMMATRIYLLVEILASISTKTLERRPLQHLQPPFKIHSALALALHPSTFPHLQTLTQMATLISSWDRTICRLHFTKTPAAPLAPCLEAPMSLHLV